MRYAFLVVMVMVLHVSAVMACETQSDAQLGDSSTTVMKRDCSDQVVPHVEPHKELPAIPSAGVQITPGLPKLSDTQVSPVSEDRHPKTAPKKRLKRRASTYNAVVRRLHGRHKRKIQKPMFWWHIRK